LTAADPRHLSTPTLMRHWEAGVPILIPLVGKPSLRLRLDPPKGRLTLRAPVAEHVSLPIQVLAHVTTELHQEAGVRYIEISTTDDRLVVDGYAMLMAIADRIQLEHVEPLPALEDTLKLWRSILAERVRMSLQTEVGLFGELLIVRALLDTSVAAATSWRGGLAEEHDFGFDDADVEIKTTTGERRHHWIHGLTQLVETAPTPLWIVSLQITRAGDGDGETLPALIDSVLAATSDVDRSVTERNLTAVGWQEDARDLFDERWRLRTRPLALRVDDALPRLTPALLVSAGIDTARLREVIYEIDITDRSSPAKLPTTLNAILVDLTETVHAH
jgi:hypothetical protein